LPGEWADTEVRSYGCCHVLTLKCQANSQDSYW